MPFLYMFKSVTSSKNERKLLYLTHANNNK